MFGWRVRIQKRPDAGPLWSVESMGEAVVVVLLTLMWAFTALMVGIWVVGCW
jgi:hypothetical protein